MQLILTERVCAAQVAQPPRAASNTAPRVASPDAEGDSPAAGNIGIAGLPPELVERGILPFLAKPRDLLAFRAVSHQTLTMVDNSVFIWSQVAFAGKALHPRPRAGTTSKAWDDRAAACKAGLPSAQLQRHHALLAVCGNNPSAMLHLLEDAWAEFYSLLGELRLDTALSNDNLSCMFEHDVVAVVLKAIASVLDARTSTSPQRSWSFQWKLQEAILVQYWQCLVLAAMVRVDDDPPYVMLILLHTHCR